MVGHRFRVEESAVDMLEAEDRFSYVLELLFVAAYDKVRVVVSFVNGKLPLLLGQFRQQATVRARHGASDTNSAATRKEAAKSQQDGTNTRQELRKKPAEAPECYAGPDMRSKVCTLGLQRLCSSLL